MQCIHREDNSIRFVPNTSLARERGGALSIPLQPQAEHFPVLALPGHAADDQHPPHLETEKALITYGYRAESLYQEILLRLLLPFTFLLANLYMAALGWRLRFDTGGCGSSVHPGSASPPPLSGGPLLYLHGIKVLLGFLLVSADFWAAAGIMLGFRSSSSSSPSCPLPTDHRMIGKILKRLDPWAGKTDGGGSRARFQVPGWWGCFGAVWAHRRHGPR
jgi:hypothetical protein